MFPGEHFIDNRPGFAIKKDPSDPSRAVGVSPLGAETLATTEFALSLTSEFDLTVNNNILYRFNSVNGGVIVPRGTSLVGLDLRKLKLDLCMYPTQQMMMSPILLFLGSLVTVTSGSSLCLMEKMIA